MYPDNPARSYPSSFLLQFFSSIKVTLWPASKGVTHKKHRPFHFGYRIVDFGFFSFFSIRIPQSTIRNPDGPLAP
jgi:hypothetical protein